MDKRMAFALMLWMCGMAAQGQAATNSDKDVRQANIEKKLESIEAKLKKIEEPELEIEMEAKENKEEKVREIAEEAAPGGKERKKRELDKILRPKELWSENYQPERRTTTSATMELGFYVLCVVVIVQTYAIISLIKDRREANKI